MKKIQIVFFLVLSSFLYGCAHEPMKFRLAAGTNQNDYQEALKECGGDSKQGGYFLFGPLILVAPAVAVIEGVKANKRADVQNCMEAKGFKCVENCPDPLSPKFARKPIDPKVLAQWEEIIKIDKTKEWVFYGKAPKGSMLYYDPASIALEDQRYILFREQLTLPVDNPENLSYIWRTTKVNCVDKIFKFSNFVALDKDGQTTDPGAVETEWRNLPETSQLGIIAYKICGENIQKKQK